MTLKLYYARPSAYARPVWLALLEKQLPFELIPVDLSGEQFQPEFLAVNPFGRVPVLVDGDHRVVESLAILDYLEAQYPNPSLMPQAPHHIATVRMVQLITLNELLPALFRLLTQPKNLNQASDAQQTELAYARSRASSTLKFLARLLGEKPYFAGDQLTLAEIVAGTVIHRLPELGIALQPRLAHWSERLLARPTWQQIALSPAEQRDFQRYMRVLPKIWQRRRRQKLKALTQGP
ncbi:MAG: glutathione S-transferase family protein [Cyanobacteria bacterium J06632_22]